MNTRLQKLTLALCMQFSLAASNLVSAEMTLERPLANDLKYLHERHCDLIHVEGSRLIEENDIARIEILAEQAQGAGFYDQYAAEVEAEGLMRQRRFTDAERLLERAIALKPMCELTLPSRRFRHIECPKLFVLGRIRSKLSGVRNSTTTPREAIDPQAIRAIGEMYLSVEGVESCNAARVHGVLTRMLSSPWQ